MHIHSSLANSNLKISKFPNKEGLTKKKKLCTKAQLYSSSQKALVF